jgi:hypothetical protein
MDIMLMGVWHEQRDIRFMWGDDKIFAVGQALTSLRFSLRSEVRVGILGDDLPILKSSAKAELIEAVWGKSEVKKLKREGEITEPWGTPEQIIREEEIEERKRQKAERPRM